jgi:PAS domain S-box-containing protein
MKEVKMGESAVESSSDLVVGVNEKELIRVLHVDDEADFLEVAQQVLEMEGAFQVDAALTVEEAKEKMQTKKYDAIICDYMMPRRGGLQFLRELRDGGNKIPFIIFTGKGREGVAAQALNLGADGYFSKIGSTATVYTELAHGIRQVVKSRRRGDAREKAEELYRSVVELSPDSVVTVDTSGVITTCNTAATMMLGYSKDELIGKHFSKIGVIGAKDLPKYVRLLSSVLKGKTTRSLKLAFKRKDGTPFLAEVRVGLLKKGDKTIGIQAVSRVIREHKQDENSTRSI